TFHPKNVWAVGPMAAAMLFDLRILPSVTVADAPRDTLPLSKLEHAVPVHDIAENPVEGNFSGNHHQS
ncbi:MAG TPA: hypothetical protein VMT78_11470, partial [Terriglobia bacterium]|nr:hypothetical protein [Terriglobia bacterium]